MRSRFTFIICAIAVLALAVSAPRALAYIDISPTLGWIVRGSAEIALVEVDKVHREKRIVIYKKVLDVKGHLADAPIKHQLADGHPPREPRHILDWASPGQRAVLFVYRGNSWVCIGHTWYEAHRATAPAGPVEDDAPRGAARAASGTIPQLVPWWRMSLDRPELALVYCGSTTKLARHVKDILDGKRVVVTTVAHGAQGRGSFSDCVFNDLQAGAFPPLQRLYASLNMPGTVFGIDMSSPWFVGVGAMTEAQIPAAAAALDGPNAQDRIDAMTELASLGAAAKTALPAIRKLMADSGPAVRLSAATAVARIDPGDPRALTTLVGSLSDSSPLTRRIAAQCLARLGPSAQSALEPLLKLVRQADPDENVRAAAVDAIGRLRGHGAGAVPDLIELLSDKSLRCTAAESLGRIGPKAAEALPLLAAALNDKDATWQWTAARAMVLIGGEGARPAVRFLVQRLIAAPRGRELYQLTWCLGLLGPVASDAIPHLRQAQNRDNELVAMAVWAVAPESEFPWQIGYNWNRPCDLWLFADYIDRMGDRATAAAVALATKILEGRAGSVPPWGYHLIKARPEAAMPILKKGLEHENHQVQRRARVALEAIRLAPDAL